jgi:NADH:ubiquinone oxidoreductase subunit 2 (subunit N)
VMMYMREARKEVPVTRVPIPLGVALATCLAATLYLGLFPNSVLQYSQESAWQLVHRASPEAPSSVPPRFPQI